MAKKEKKISVNALETVMKERFQNVVTERWFDFDVTIKGVLSLQDALQFVKDVVESCFLEDGTYVPEVKDFAIRSGVLTSFANFTLPSNIKKRYELVYCSDAYDFVISHINSEYFHMLMTSIDEKLEHILDEAYGRRLGGVDIDAESIERIIQSFGSDGINEGKVVDAYMGYLNRQ